MFTLGVILSLIVTALEHIFFRNIPLKNKQTPQHRFEETLIFSLIFFHYSLYMHLTSVYILKQFWSVSVWQTVTCNNSMSLKLEWIHRGSINVKTKNCIFKWPKAKPLTGIYNRWVGKKKEFHTCRKLYVFI